METLKKLLVLLLALSVVFCFAACNSDEPEETEPTLNQGDANCDHAWTDWEVVKENSCSKNGKQERECEECGKQEEEELLAYGHIYSGGECVECEKKSKDCEHAETYAVVMLEATCTSDGEEREVCKRCKAVVERNYIPAYWHSEMETVVVQQPTCTENGLEQQICKLCNEVVYENTIWSNGHEYTYVDGQQPTCTDVGWYSYSYCTVCDYVRNYEERPATGHTYRADTCGTCGFVNTAFEVITAPGLTNNQLTIENPVSVPYDALAAKIDTFTGEVKKGSTDTWTFTAEIDGRYLIWLSEVYNNYYLKLQVYNSLGERIDYDNYMYNNDGRYYDLTAGEYTIKLSYGDGSTTYNVSIGYAKDVVDISGYDVVNDQMQFNRQTIKYTFVPTVSGVYYFYLGEMTGNAEMSMAMYNRLNERIEYSGYLSNGEGLKVNLTAGETYTLHIENAYNYLTAFKIYIGKQKVTQDISGYTAVADSITYKHQVNYYTFVATSTECRIELSGIADNQYMSLSLYNYLGERLDSDGYCYNGEGFTKTNLVVGDTYTVVVAYSYGTSDYVLHMYSAKAPVAVNSDMGVRDKIEYGDQTNVYTFTVDREGYHKIMLIVHSYENYSCLSISIYDANGNRIKNDSSVYDGNYFDMGNLTVGATYTIYVNEYGGDVDYTLSIQE